MRVGPLEPWDAYFLDTNQEAFEAFLDRQNTALGLEPSQPVYGELFLQNLRYIHTFISRAKFDLLVYAPALAPVLQSYAAVERVTLTGSEPGERLRVEYADGLSRTIASPYYAQSSHAVLRGEPTSLLADIAAFVERSQL